MRYYVIECPGDNDMLHRDILRKLVESDVLLSRTHPNRAWVQFDDPAGFHDQSILKAGLVYDRDREGVLPR